MEIEQHPLEPFLPTNAKLLMLGSFPPQRKRWSMEFYYPNWNNDMWRIVGLIFFVDKEHFVVKEKRHCPLRHSNGCPTPAGQCIRQVSGSGTTHGCPQPARKTSPMPRHRHHRRKGYRYIVPHVLPYSSQGGRLHRIPFRRTSPASLSHALFLAGLSVGPGQESDCLSSHVSGLANAIKESIIGDKKKNKAAKVLQNQNFPLPLQPQTRE